LKLTLPPFPRTKQRSVIVLSVTTMMMSSIESSIISDGGGEGEVDEEDIVAATRRLLSTHDDTLTTDSILGSDHPIPIDDGSIDVDDGDDRGGRGDDGEGGGDDTSSIVESLQSGDIIASISGCGSSGDEHLSFNDDDDNMDDLYEHEYYTTTTIHGEEDDGGSNISYHSNDDNDDDDEVDDAIVNDDDDDLSLGFPPGYVLTLDELDDPLQKNTNINDVNPSIVPSFFFCPLTRSIMRDPVITPDGYTYERRAILRYLCLGLGLDPMSNNPLQHVHLVDDRLVRQAIDKARKEAWIRYVVQLPIIDDDDDDDENGNDKIVDDDDYDDVMNDTYHEEEINELDDSKIDKIISVVNKREIEMSGRDDDDDNDDGKDEGEPSKMKSKSRRHHHHLQQQQQQLDADENNTVSTPTLSNNTEQLMLSPSSQSNHGWSVPLGVHRITCMSPGLPVTADVHRRSNIVQRKIIHNSLAKDDDNEKEMVGSYRKSKQKTKKKKMGAGAKIVTGVKTRDLLLPSGSYVEILETRVHGGRVRGRIVWEEEVSTEYDHDVILHLEEIEVRERAMTRPKQQQQQHNANNINNDSPIKKRIGRKATVGAAVRKASAVANKTLFRRKSISSGGMGGNAGLFASDLFDATIMSSLLERGNESIGEREDREEDLVDTSPSPLTTIKYSGWISLQWAGSEDNKERDEVIERQRRTSGKIGETSLETALSSVAADEDDGPWSQPLPLGVYRIGVSGDNVGDVVTNDDDHRDAGHLPLHDAPDDESNAIDYLVPGQCIEIVETQVLVVKKKKKKLQSTKDGRIYTKYSYVDAMGEQVVRARCMVPVVIVPPTSMNTIIAKPQQKFRNGWITLFGGEGTTKDLNCSVAAFPIPLGAYIFKADDPLLLGDNKVKFPIGSIVEIVTTRIEFEDKEREGMQHSVAVRGLVASGGYVTLCVISIGASGTSLRLSGFVRSEIYAAPVPLGTYRITHPTNLSPDVLKNAANDDVVIQLEKNERVRIVETRVEDGCVRGRVGEVFSARRSRHINSKDTQKTIGWISLFEPPSLRWAEHIPEGKEVP